MPETVLLSQPSPEQIENLAILINDFFTVANVEIPSPDKLKSILPAPDDRKRLLERLTQNDPDAIYDWCRKYKPEPQSLEIEACLAGWLEHSLSNAYSYAQKHNNYELIRKVAQKAIERKDEVAYEAARYLHLFGDGDQKLALQAGWALLETAPDKSYCAGKEFEDPVLLEAAGRKLIAQNPEFFLSFGGPGPDVRDLEDPALTAVVTKLMKKARAFLKTIPPPPKKPPLSLLDQIHSTDQVTKRLDLIDCLIESDPYTAYSLAEDEKSGAEDPAAEEPWGPYKYKKTRQKAFQLFEKAKQALIEREPLIAYCVSLTRDWFKSEQQELETRISAETSGDLKVAKQRAHRAYIERDPHGGISTFFNQFGESGSEKGTDLEPETIDLIVEKMPSLRGHLALEAFRWAYRELVTKRVSRLAERVASQVSIYWNLAVYQDLVRWAFASQDEKEKTSLTSEAERIKTFILQLNPLIAATYSVLRDEAFDRLSQQYHLPKPVLETLYPL